jgi:hypothetical protein
MAAELLGRFKIRGEVRGEGCEELLFDVAVAVHVT